MGSIVKCAGGRITSPFGARAVPGSHVPKHLGIDIGHGDGAPADLVIVAPADGIVTAAGTSGSYGSRLVIDHGDGWTSLIAHLESRRVSRGDEVTRGQHIATMGNTGTVHVHAHQEYRRLGIPVDPEQYLATSSSTPSSTPRPPASPTIGKKTMYLARDITNTHWLVCEDGWRAIPNVPVLQLLQRLLESTPRNPPEFNRVEVKQMNDLLKSAVFES